MIAMQALEFHRPVGFGTRTEAVHATIRAAIPRIDTDRYLHETSCSPRGSSARIRFSVPSRMLLELSNKPVNCSPEATMNAEYDLNFIDGTEDNLYPAIDGSVLRRSLKTLMKPAFCVDIGTPVSQAIAIMQTKRMGCVLVTNREKLFGIFTERDVLKKILGAPFDLKSTPITEVMTTNPQALNDDDTIAYAMNFMDLGGYRHIPIVNHDFVPVGVVSVKDIVSYFVEHFADEVLSLPPHPYSTADDALPADGDLPEEDSSDA